MSSLQAMFRNVMASYKDLGIKSEKIADVGYPTGFPNFDMRNATTVHVYNEDKGLNYSYYMMGIPDGSMTTIIGRSGCGKSTLAYQMAANIVRPFKNGLIYADEIEVGMQQSRKETLTKFSGAELKDRLICRDTGITSENFYERIKIIHDLKVNAVSEFEYDTGYLDYKGDPIHKLEPTCYILDSWALLRPQALTEEETLSTQMSVTSAAKMNTEILRRIIPMLKNANINLFIINHILQEVKINPYDTTPSQVRYLAPGERCPGGSTIMYLANTLIKLHDTNLKLNFGFDGAVISCKILKSRTNKAGQETFFIYNQEIGYDPELSMYYCLYKDKLVQASGAWMYFTDHSEIKFQQKAFKEKLKSDAAFRKLFMDVCYEYFSKMASKADEAQQQEDDSSVTTEFYGKLNEPLTS